MLFVFLLVFGSCCLPTQCLDAEAARMVLDKKFFAGRQITCELYDESLFNKKDYTQ